MKKDTYLKMTRPFRENAKLARSLHIINKIITYAMVLLYMGLLVYYACNQDERLIRAIIVPLDSFIIVTVFRYMLNRKRPYEHFDIPPVIQKDTAGKSFPSRHVFSAFIIAMTYLCWSPLIWAGTVLLVLAAGMAVVRVISGVHYISDVAAGAVCGIAAGVLGYVII